EKFEPAGGSPYAGLATPPIEFFGAAASGLTRSTPMEMIDILKAAVQKGASDLHLVIGQAPMIRQDGDLKSMTEFPVLTAAESRRLIYTLLSDEQRARFERDWELDFSVA